MSGQKRISTKDLSPCVYHELENFGLFDTFFPTTSLSNMLAIQHSIDNDSDEKGDGISEKDAITHFISFRSNSFNSSTNMINWDYNNGRPFLQSGETINTMVEIDSSNRDLSKIKILKTGWYRIMMRVVASISSSYYVRLMVNGSVKKYCYQSNNGTTYDKTFYINDVMELQANNYIQFYSNIATKANCAKGSYLCIERIPPAMQDKLGIWQSSSSTSNYRQWNASVKTCNELYELKGSAQQLWFKVKYFLKLKNNRNSRLIC